MLKSNSCFATAFVIIFILYSFISLNNLNQALSFRCSIQNLFDKINRASIELLTKLRIKAIYHNVSIHEKILNYCFMV